MLVMGGIVGSGIFINPYVVAGLVRTPALILGVGLRAGQLHWLAPFIYAELADRIPKSANNVHTFARPIHPLLGFLYGWSCLLVIHAGGSAAVAVTFAKYCSVFTHGAVPEKFAAVAVVLVSGCELPGRARRRECAKRLHAAAHCGDCDDCGVRRAAGLLADGVAAGERGAHRHGFRCSIARYRLIC